MRIPDRFSVRAAMLAMCGALLGACGSARAPSGYRPQLEELDRHLFGAWVIIETGRGSAVRVYEGELLAVGATHVTVLDSTGARGIAIVGMSLAELEVHESSGAAMAGWTVAGAVSTLSHGWVLLLTAPMWIIGGTISTAATANAGYHYQHNPDAAWWRTMTIYARYPQGLPSGLDVTTLRPWRAVVGNGFIDPTGTYKLVARDSLRDGERFGPVGELAVDLIDSSTIAVSFHTDNGAPAYNSGGFVDTLAYAAGSAVYRSDLDTTCRMRLVFDRKVCRIDTRSEQQAACGFGHGVRPSGYYRKTSSRKPVIKGYWEE